MFHQLANANGEEREQDARQQLREERERSAAAEARAAVAVHQVRAEQERAAAAEQHAGELRRLLDDELAALRAEVAAAQAVAGPDENRATAIGRRPLSRWSWLRGFNRRPSG